MIKECAVCHKPIEYHWPGHMVKYCKDCAYKTSLSNWRIYNKKRNKEANKFCLDCNKSLSWENKTGYCLKCLLGNHRYGENCPSWKGGRRIRDGGYVFIYHPEPHPRRRIDSKNKPSHRPTCYVAEHILVWEKNHNQFLPEGYTVHHLNGIRDDNRTENLVALPTPRHSSGLVNRALQERIRGLEAIIAQFQMVESTCN